MRINKAYRSQLWLALFSGLSNPLLPARSQQLNPTHVPIYAQTKQLEQQAQASTRQIQQLTKQLMSLRAALFKLTAKSVASQPPTAKQQRPRPAALMQQTARAMHKQRQVNQLQQTISTVQSHLRLAQQQQQAWNYRVQTNKKTAAQKLLALQHKLAAAKAQAKNLRARR
ncbi:MAG TPA: hypothetical protein VJJ83_02345 [Candidatus Babeliales bacterium]|nr:hypothetical protein [Candidatus Babeliales bacterium]